jgi:hypothetical protein
MTDAESPQAFTELPSEIDNIRITLSDLNPPADDGESEDEDQ